MFTVTGGTYAYLAFTASDANTIVGTTATADLELVVERKLPSNVGVMVPQLEEYLGSAISTTYSCIDGNGNTVCQVYKATLTNTSTATVKVNGTIAFTGIDNMPNLKWKRIKDERTIGAYTSYNASTTDAYFERNESFQPGESMTYYFVIWIDETGEVQTDSGTFRTIIKFNPADGEGLTSTVVPISYMTGFSSSTDYSYYRSDTYREKIKNVYFVDYINTTGSVASWDMSDLNMNEAGSVMAWVNTNASDSNYYDLYIGANQLIGGVDFSWLFRDMTNVESINFDNFDTRVTTNMQYMFWNCINLTVLDVSGFDTSSVISMRGMFAGGGSNVINLEYLDVSGFDTSNVTDMAGMFQNCEKLVNLDVSGFDTSNVTNMMSMFVNCKKIKNLDVSGFDTSGVTNMGSIFGNCEKITSLDVSGFDTSQVTNMSYMFQNCDKLTSLEVSKWDTSSVTDMSFMFASCNELMSLDVSEWDTSNVTNMNRMFSSIKLTSLDVSNWNTSKVTDMLGMFYNCVNLTSLDVSEFDTSNVTSMSFMFAGGDGNVMNFDNLDVSKWDTSKVTDMSNMFKNCIKLTTLNVGNWNTSNVTNMHQMFAGVKETEDNIDINMSLITLDVSKWDTSKVTDMSGMFQNCEKLSTTITIKNSGTTSYEYMFNEAATETGASITVNYTSATSSLVDSMIATKSSDSNVVKGSLVS